MPKTIKGKTKSGRKALSNISNRAVLPSQTNKSNAKQAHCNDNGDVKTCDDAALDRLHIVHASLSQLINQIDGLVTRAHKLRLAQKLGLNDIEGFMEVLSSTHFKLQVWLPKFEQAFGCISVTAEKQTLPLSPIVSSSVQKDENLFPLDGFRQSLSPSPLVSWHLGITSDCGRELFALTPLPKSRARTELKKLSSLKLTESGDINELTSVLKTPLPSKHPSKTPQKLKAVTPQNVEFVTPRQAKAVTPRIPQSLVSKYSSIFKEGQSQFTEDDHLKFCATPGPEISPPKTCLLMRPIAESFQQSLDSTVQSTPLLSVNFRKFDGSPSSYEQDLQIPKSLRIKYPDLFKRISYDCLPMKTLAQMSPQIEISPPKTCVLMIPSTEMLSDVNDVSDLQKQHERDKSSSLSDFPPTLSFSADCPELRKNGELSQDKIPMEEHFIDKHHDFVFQALEVSTSGTQMMQTKEDAKGYPESCVASSSRLMNNDMNDFSHMPTHHNSDFTFPSFAMAYCTPVSKIVPKDHQNAEQMGKQPGEQTLRRELWSKFEEESADAYPKQRQDFKCRFQEPFLETNSCANNGLQISSLANSVSSRKEVIPEQKTITFERSAAKVSAMEGAEKSCARDRLQKAGDASLLYSMKQLEVGRARKIDLIKSKTPGLQLKAKQASGKSIYL